MLTALTLTVNLRLEGRITDYTKILLHDTKNRNEVVGVIPSLKMQRCDVSSLYGLLIFTPVQPVTAI